MQTTVALHDEIISIKVPITLKRYRGQMWLVLPKGEMLSTATTAKPNETLVKGITRAYVWQRALDVGQFSSISKLSEHKQMSPSYVSRLLRLNLLSPHIKQAILEGTQPPELDLQDMLSPFPLLWDEQLVHFGFER